MASYLLSVLILICIFLSPPCFGLASDPNTHSGPFTNGNDAATESSGPTLIMSYSGNKSIKNPIASFMYFVPLISPTLVDNISSVNNDQQVEIISNNLVMNSETFSLRCEFEVLGSGFHMNTFDPAGMIAANVNELKNGNSLTNMLDYIKIEGNCFGVIEVEGTISNSNRTVNKVAVKFNAKGHKSTVTIGLYDIKPIKGQYSYENKTAEMVVYVNSLIFKKTDKSPHMGIEIASIVKEQETAGIFASIKGAIANWFIKPPRVDNIGNTAILEFGYALLQKNSTFTFPKAKNIRVSKML